MLKIAKNLDLPLDAVTNKIAILGMSGSGKSYTKSLQAETTSGKLPTNASVRIHSVEAAELPHDGERVVALSTCFGHLPVYLLTNPQVYWNARKKRFTGTHGAPLTGFSVEYWFYESDLVSGLK